MALKGNLRDFSLYQLLNLINLAHKTGALTVAGPKRQGTARLFFKEGKLIDAELDGRDPSLAQVLIRMGKLTSEQARAVQQRATVNTDKEFGLLLIHSGLLTQNDILAGIRASLLDTVYGLFSWPEGNFVFEPSVLPSPERITVPIALDNVIIEGSRRIKESERLKDELPDLNVPLRFAERPSSNLHNISLSVEEWKVISFINSRNTIQQIADFLRMDESRIRRVVYGLSTAGLVQIGPAPLGRGGFPAQPAPAARFSRNILLRIIDGIRRR